MTALDSPLAWLFGLEQFGIKLGLENISVLLDALGHPERAFRSVHVAGTNGKGSVTAIVDEALRAAGHRSARYTSPHLVDLSERFVVAGRPIDRESLTAAVEDVQRLVDRLRREGALDVQPTFFETTTAIAFELFRRAGVEIAVCEVGLGGRLDATNALLPLACAITSIGFDHQQYLGHTLRDIALEKAGILKPGVPAIVGRMSAEAFAGISGRARALGAPLLDAWEGVDVVRLDSSNHSTRIRLRTLERDYGECTVGLAGDHQIDNAVIAVRLIETLRHRVPVTPDAIRRGLTHVTWPGRLDLRRLPDGREALLDAAHNADGAAALAAFLTSKSSVKQPLVFAAMRDKDRAAMIRALMPAVARLIVTRASNPRSADPAELAAEARRIAPVDVPVEVQPVLSAALASGWRESPRITVAGSIFLLGDVMKELGWA